VTFIVRGLKSDDATTAVRLRADTAVAKARDLIVEGWDVFIECPDGIQNYPDDFDNLLSDSQDDSALPLRKRNLDVPVWRLERPGPWPLCSKLRWWRPRRSNAWALLARPSQEAMMAHISDYSIITYERKPGHWRAAISPKTSGESIVPGDTVRSFVTPYDSASEAEANSAAEKLIRKLWSSMPDDSETIALRVTMIGRQNASCASYR
jgi:hypothetical protein